jgi:hypothetical protein
MFGLLVRVGIDQTYGKWNAPVDPVSNAFVYIPIPEDPEDTPRNKKRQFRPGLRRDYNELLPALEKFGEKYNCDLTRNLRLPPKLKSEAMHLDPDFDYLTYGDTNRKLHRRGKKIEDSWNRHKKHGGGFLAFYAGLKPIKPCDHKLIYALIGFYDVVNVEKVKNVPESRASENAHTRRDRWEDTDIVVRAKKGVSGRLEKCILIGELRGRHYRVLSNLLKKWGGLSVKDGYIHRSAVLPSFNDPEKFYKWFQQKKVRLLKRNN